MKRTKALVAVSSVLAIAFTLAAASNPKTTGDSGWMNGSVEAHTTFNAINTSPTGPAAKGSLIYSDANIVYSMDVQFLTVLGNQAWFAGQVTSVQDITGADSGCCRVGNWILYKIVDNGEPGIGADQIFGEDLGRDGSVNATAGGAATGLTINATSVMGVVTGMKTPLGGPFTINDGNMQVHK